MAPPNKKSDFMVFVKHWRSNNPGLSVPQAVSRCGVIWEKMTALERLPFVESNKINNKPKKGLSEADKAQLELDEREEHLKRTTERIVKQGKKSQDLEKTKFLFCAFNYFTKDPDRDVYVPAEFAACEYSLKEGIISVFSTLIDPGQLNLGLSRGALEHSMATHNLPLPPAAIGERNLAKLHSQMIRYLAKNQSHRPAIVFTTTEMRPIVQSCFRFLACNSKDEFLLNILVADIQYLFFVLKKEILDMVGLPNDKINTYITDAVFLRDFFECTNDIACEFHEENDRAKYCTQSMVTRWAFTFSDYMCGDMSITVEPGRHVPSTVKPNYRIHNADTSSGTLGCGSSVESFHSLASFQSLRINEVKKGRPLRMDISAISSRCSGGAFEEVKEYDRQGGSRLDEFSDAFVPISSRCSSTCSPHADADQMGSLKYPRQAGSHRNPSVNLQRDSPEEFLDEISSIGSRRSGASLLHGATDQRGSSKAEKYPRQAGSHRNPSFNLQCDSPEEYPDEISSTGSRRSGASIPYGATDQKGSSNIEKYPRQAGSHRNPSFNLQCDSPEEFLDEISSIGSRRSGASLPHGATDQKGSSKIEKYPRQAGYPRSPSLNMQRDSPEEFPDEISSIGSRRSGASLPHGATDQKGSSKIEKYPRQADYLRSPSLNMQRDSPEEFSDEWE